MMTFFKYMMNIFKVHDEDFQNPTMIIEESEEKKTKKQKVR